MPQIDIAMVASRAQPLFPRASSISGEVSSVKNTFSSWYDLKTGAFTVATDLLISVYRDNCMAETYCKYGRLSRSHLNIANATIDGLS